MSSYITFIAGSLVWTIMNFNSVADIRPCMGSSEDILLCNQLWSLADGTEILSGINISLSGMVANTCNARTQEAEAEGLAVRSQPIQQVKIKANTKSNYHWVKQDQDQDPHHYFNIPLCISSPFWNLSSQQEAKRIAEGCGYPGYWVRGLHLLSWLSLLRWYLTCCPIPGQIHLFFFLLHPQIHLVNLEIWVLMISYLIFAHVTVTR